MTRSLSPHIEHELEHYRQVERLLSEQARQRIQARVQAWHCQLTQPAPTPVGRTPALVMRPGLPPRPLDPFYFTVTRLP